jgi:hypothetical protein
MGVYATFPGIEQVQRASYTAVRGLMPGYAHLEILPQETLPTTIGDLVIGDDLNSVTIYNCIVDGTSLRRSENGMIIGVTLKDSRWTWQRAGITGMYNVRRIGGVIDTPTERSPRQLLTLLFTAMGSPSVDVSAVPNSSRPEVDWEGTRAWAAATKLMQALGCEYVPSYDGGGVGAVVPMGSGSTLTPDAYTQSVTLSSDLEEWPDNLVMLSDRDARQVMVLLEAVVLEENGEIVLEDDASYKPDIGWIRTDPDNPLPDADTITQGLAKESFRKWYRPKAFMTDSGDPEDANLDLPGYDIIEGTGAPSSGTGSPGQYYINTVNGQVYGPKVGSVWTATTEIVRLDTIQQATPFLPKLISDVDSGYGYKQSYPVIQGFFAKRNGAENLENSQFEILETRYDWDYERGIFKFSEPVAKLVSGGYGPAELYAIVAFHVLSDDRTQYARYSVTRNLANNNVPDAQDMANGIRRTFVSTYLDNALDSTTNNEALVEAELENRLDAWENEFGTRNATYMKSMGIRPTALSGCISTVRWVADHWEGANTWAAQNSESNVNSYRRSERYRMALAELARELNDSRLRSRRERGD